MKRLLIISAMLATALTGASLSLEAAASQVRQTERTATLFYHPSCSHCMKVISYLKEQNGTITLKNIDQPQYRSEFKSLGQKGVPVLVVGSQTIAGDTAIISYLNNHPELMK